MASAQYSVNVTVAGYNAAKSVVRSGDHPNAYEVTLPVAHALSSWVKTDADTAAGNLTAGHGLSTGTFDIYWDGGARYDVPCTITTNAVALDGGSGTDFPASATATVRMSPQTAINTAIDGDAIKLAFIKLQYADVDEDEERGRLLFEDADGDDIADLKEANGIIANRINVYDVEGGDTNPLTGDPITDCHASHSNTAAAATLIIATLEDSTP
jgi:hypothetical protein